MVEQLRVAKREQQHLFEQLREANAAIAEERELQQKERQAALAAWRGAASVV